MHDDGLLNISEGGLLASAHFIGYLLGALAAGRLQARSSVSLYSALVVIALSTVTIGLTNSFAIWLVARWLAGLCSALVLVTVSTQIVIKLAELARPELQGLVFAGVGGGISIAGAVALLWSVSGLSSSVAWIVFGLASLVVTAVIYGFASGTGSVDCERDHTNSRARHPLQWQLTIPYGMMGVGYIIPATYLPIMARDTIGSPILFGMGWPVFGLAATLSTLIITRFQSRFTNRRIWIVSQLIMALGLAIPALVPGTGYVVFGGICVGGTFMIITMVGVKEAHRLAGPGQAQKLVATMTTAFASGQVVAPPVAGLIYESTGSFAFPLLLGSVLLVASLIPFLRH